MRGAAVWRRVHHTRGDGGLLGELVEGRGLLNDVMCDRREMPVALGAQADALDGRRAIASQRKHLLPRERELHWSAYHLRGHHGENDVWMGEYLSSRMRHRRRAR